MNNVRRSWVGAGAAAIFAVIYVGLAIWLAYDREWIHTMRMRDWASITDLAPALLQILTYLTHACLLAAACFIYNTALIHAISICGAVEVLIPTLEYIFDPPCCVSKTVIAISIVSTAIWMLAHLAIDTLEPVLGQVRPLSTDEEKLPR